ncbi:MAG: sigma-54 dependent transcriptional regulator [bacterium]
MPQHILIIDDDPAVAQTLVSQLSALGFVSTVAPDGETGDRAIRSATFDLVLLDLSLPDHSGLELLRRWQEDAIQVPIVMISGTATIPDAVEALKRGALDFLVKPVDMRLLEVVVNRTLGTQRLRKENLRLRELTQEKLVEFLGRTQATKTLLAEASKVALSDQPVLIEGETGTGKQVLARHIHSRSPWAAEPFVGVNCAAITETLFESELFGHEKGAFTGAVSRKPGKLELVGRGSLFLDEVGELPTNCQAKLLTALEDRVFERVGGISSLEFEGRVIVATNRNLNQEIEKGNFRKDLFYRLNTFRIQIPPLRERKDDIPLFAERMIQQCRRKYHRHVSMPDDATMESLKEYPWPGNVRELFHHVERIALLSESAEIPSSMWLSFPFSVPELSSAMTEDLRAAVEAFKKQHILGIVRSCGGNQTEAARRLGIERTHLNRVLAEYEGRR